MESQKKNQPFALRLPVELDAEIRAVAQGNGDRPPSSINDTIVMLLREALAARRARTVRGVQDSEPGNSTTVRRAA